MFQASSEGWGQPKSKRYVRTPKVREFTIFLVSCELYMGTFQSRHFFHFFKAGTISESIYGPRLERFESPATPQFIFLARLDSLGMGFQGLLLALRMDDVTATFGSWDSHRLVFWQLIRASCLSSARQLDVLPSIWPAVFLTPAPREHRVSSVE